MVIQLSVHGRANFRLGELFPPDNLAVANPEV